MACMADAWGTFHRMRSRASLTRRKAGLF